MRTTSRSLIVSGFFTSIEHTHTESHVFQMFVVLEIDVLITRFECFIHAYSCCLGDNYNNDDQYPKAGSDSNYSVYEFLFFFVLNFSKFSRCFKCELIV